jgi:peptidyl-dipeptidase Dcp
MGVSIVFLYIMNEFIVVFCMISNICFSHCIISWRYYAEKVRIAKYDFDESVLRPYLSLSKVTDAMMAVSNKLFGLHYIKRDDIQSYHPDVDTYEVRETLEDGTDKLVAIFIHDNFARKYKSSGAWMSEYRGQTKNLKEGENDMLSIPIISNNNNFAKSSGLTLLSMDDSVTLFHEAGHGHHGMLSDVTYGRLAGTSVLTDFVELPSQLMEHWLEQPEVLKEYALHYETNEPIPDELLNKLKAAKSFNQGFETIEYTSCALLDMALHQLEDYDGLDISEFEKKELDRLGMPQGIIMRHRPAHFLHLFASSHYASGYYVYLWAEVLDADAFAAFKETGDIFDPEMAKRVKKYIYSSGNTVAPDELFRSFRGRDPDIQFMLEKKGLA